MGNRVFKGSTVNGNRKYVIDISGGLPTILLEINPTNGSILRTYVYANSQILMQHSGAPATNNKYFYLHDRLGSVRQVIGADGLVKNYYTYKPFGEVFATENTENVSNPFKFTGQYFDSEISEYYLRARQYDPHTGRFTSRDPVAGKFKKPLSLHKYLYCENDTVNHIDPNGRTALDLVSPILTGSALYAHGIDLATYAVASGNDKFWELSDLTFKFMPVGMAIALCMPPRGFSDLLYKLSGGVTAIAGTFNPFDTSGMSIPEAYVMDPAAFGAYSLYMGTAETLLGVSFADMRDFSKWRGAWGW